MGLLIVTEATKLSINPDSFIYSVNQAYTARLKSNGAFDSHLCYEPFLIGTWVMPELREYNIFKKQLNDIILHHSMAIPHFQRKESVNLENIAWFSQSTAALFADIEFLLLNFTGASLPQLVKNAIPKLNSNKTIVLALEKYSNYLSSADGSKEKMPFSLFPLSSEEGENLENVYSDEVWSFVTSYVRKYFAAYEELFVTYALWKYSKKEHIKEAIDWNVRPPCGAAYRKQFKELFDRERDEKRFARNERMSAKRGDKEKPFAKKSDKAFDSKDKERKKDERRPQGASHTDFKPKDAFRKDFIHKSEEASKQQQVRFGAQAASPLLRETDDKNKNMEDALKEAHKGVLEMQKNPSLFEFCLNPQNSFVRRQQHVVIAEGGFETESRGNARDRHVCILRKNN